MNLGVDLGNDAGRNAYLAAVHAVQAEFSRLTREDHSITADLRLSPSSGYAVS